ncbi:MAG: UvrD-helicase domain-containing protein [Candidatus Pacebacteria bacterium]|nr:UvrD-helicase domain-containing protein [Candidatus Paceibacterota bacterium]
MDKNKHLESLNPEQKEAVETTEGAVLIIAGAGAGKTKTITSRVLHLIKQGINPSSILAITFTNKAASEMRERITCLLSQDRELNLPISFSEKPFVSTFHSLGVFVIRENHCVLGIPRNFKIFDTGDSQKALKEALVSAGFNTKEVDASKIRHFISRKKGEGKNFSVWNDNEEKGYTETVVAKIWPLYEKILKEEGALDFDDLLLKTVNLFAHHPDILKRYQNIWTYIHIDEYQDINKVQYMLINALTRKHKNICVVGDADQNIYSWRGAQLEHILTFERDYPDAKVIFLEENYRSTKTILDVADSIIKKNTLRREKRLFTRNNEGSKVGIFSANNENDEATFVAYTSNKLIQHGVKPEEIAVLYRANFQSRALEEAFLSRNVPYQLVGTKFFERKEIKDTLAYLSLSLNPEGKSDLKRIINTPPRGIGKITFLKILEGKESSLPEKVGERVKEFRKIISQIEKVLRIKTTSETVKFVLRQSGLEEMYSKEKGGDEEKLENLRELVTLASRYDNLPPVLGIETLLSDAALVSDQDSLENNNNAVRLMTVHASKGLEFDYIFVVGLEDGLFPHKHLGEKMVTQEEAEEERRLFYVALTRARKKVCLSYVQMRTIFGSTEVALPSEFIEDIPEKYLQEENIPQEEKRKRGIEAILSIEF